MQSLKPSGYGFNAQAGDRLLFNYHSISEKDIEQGDTYELRSA